MQDKDKKKPKQPTWDDPDIPWVGPEVLQEGYSPALEKDAPTPKQFGPVQQTGPPRAARPKKTVKTSQLLGNLEEALSYGRPVPGLFDNAIARAPYQLYLDALDYPGALLQEQKTPGDLSSEREQIGRLIPKGTQGSKGLASVSSKNLEALLNRIKSSGADFKNRAAFIKQLETALGEQRAEEEFFANKPQRMEDLPRAQTPMPQPPAAKEGPTPLADVKPEPYQSPWGRDRAEDFSGDLDQIRRANLEQEQPQAKQPSELDDIISDLEGRAQPKELDLVSKIAVALSGFSMDPRVPAGLRAQLEGRADTNRAQDQLMQAKLARARMGSNERIAETKALAQGGEEDDELVNLNRDLTARKKDIELDPSYAPTRARVDLLRDKLRALGPTMDPEQLKALEAEYERQLMQLASITQKRQRAPK